MRKTNAIAGYAFALAAVTATSVMPAMAQDNVPINPKEFQQPLDKSVTAFVTGIGRNAAGGVPELESIEECKKIGLIASKMRGFVGSSYNVSCVQGGKVVTAYQCSLDECEEVAVPKP